MNKNRVISIILGAILLLGVLVIIPTPVSALASDYNENFESRAIGQLPSSTTNWYTYQTESGFTGSSTIVDGTAFGGGSTKAFEYHPTSTTGADTVFTNHIPSINPCGDAAFEFDFILGNPTATTTKHYQIGLIPKNKYLLIDNIYPTIDDFFLQLDYGATTAVGTIHGNTDTTTGTLGITALNYATKYHASFTMTCSTSTTFTLIISGFAPYVLTVGGATTGIMDDFAISSITSSPTVEYVQFDNLHWAVSTRQLESTYTYTSLAENFTSYALGQTPTSTTYTLTHTPNGVNTFQGVQDCLNLGSKCIATNTGGVLDINYLGTVSLCNSNDFSIEVGAIATAATADVFIGIQDAAYPATPTNSIIWNMHRTGAANAIRYSVVSNGVSIITNSAIYASSAGDNAAWHDILHFKCASGIVTLSLETGNTVTATTTFSSQLHHIVLGNTVLGDEAYIDNINFPVSTLLPAPPTPTNTYTVANAINGFDLSRAGEFIVDRESVGGEDTVRFLSGVNFAESYSETTQCNRLQGVVALQDDGAAYLICNAGTSSNVENMRLVDKFGDPIQGGECQRLEGAVQQQCDGTINIDSSTIDEDNMLDLNSFYPTIVNVKQHNDNTNFDDEINYFVLSASHTNGKISELFLGYSYYKTASLNPPQNAEIAHENEVSFSGSGDVITQPHDLCTSQITRNYAIARGNVIGQFDTTVTEFPNENPPAVRGGYSRTTAGNSLSDGAEAIDCNSGLVAWLTDSTVGVFNRNTDNNLWSLALPTGGSGAQAVALSDYVIQSGITRGPFMVYSFNDLTHIVNATSGVELVQIPNPVTGANGIREIGIDSVAQKLYINDKFHIYRYDIHTFTTVTPAGTGDGGNCILNCDPINGTHTTTSTSTSNPPGTGSSTSGGGTTLPPINFGTAPTNPFGINITYVADGLHVSVISIQVMVGLILVVVFSIWMYRGTGSVILATLGAGLGLIVATLMALIPAWVIMAIVLFIIVVLGKMFFGGFTGGEE